MFLLTDDIFSVISGCQQNADQMKPAATLLASAEAANWGTCADVVRHYLFLRLWPCCTLEPCEYCTSPDPSLGSSMANRTCACEQMGCRTFGLLLFFFLLLLWWKHSGNYFTFVPYSYLLATLVPPLTSNPSDVALHHWSVSNIAVTVHDTCFCLFVMVSTEVVSLTSTDGNTNSISHG